MSLSLSIYIYIYIDDFQLFLDTMRGWLNNYC